MFSIQQQNTAKDFIEMSTVKTKIMTFQAKEPICIKIYIYNKVTEQVNSFKYLGHYTTFLSFFLSKSSSFYLAVSRGFYL